MKYRLPPISFKNTPVILSDRLKKSPERASFDDCNYLELEITNNQAGSIIGQNGNNIKALRKKYNSKIIISEEATGKRVLYISSKDKFKVFGQLIEKLC